MKRVILLFIVLCGIATMKAQEVIQLDEARIDFVLDEINISDVNAIKLVVKEAFTGEFHENPIKFVRDKFDFNAFLDAVVNRDEFDEYLVTFNTRKGFLEALYSNDGDLVTTYQSFQDIVLPRALRIDLYNQHKGWTMTGNKYIASGKGYELNREVYKIKLENGNKKKTVKITPNSTLIGFVDN